MEKLKTSKKVSDFGAVTLSDCRRETTKNLKLSDSVNNNESVDCGSNTSRCNFRSSTIAKRARTVGSVGNVGQGHKNKDDTKSLSDGKRRLRGSRHHSSEEGTDARRSNNKLPTKREVAEGDSDLGEEDEDEEDEDLYVEGRNQDSLMGNPVLGNLVRSIMSAQLVDADEPSALPGSSETLSSRGNGKESSHSSPLPSSPDQRHDRGGVMMSPDNNEEGDVSPQLKGFSSSSTPPPPPPPPPSLPPSISIKKESNKSPSSSASSSPKAVKSPRASVAPSNRSRKCAAKNESTTEISASTLGAASSQSNGGASSGGSHAKNKIQEKTKIAPMVLMNNLPYMGELTFDTRPRRGRKPKKADICHLISKNYGIHFPNSYVNVPISSPTPRVTSIPSGGGSSGASGVHSSSKSAKNKPSQLLPNPSQNSSSSSSNPAESNSTYNVNERQKFQIGNDHPSTNSSSFLSNLQWNHHVPPDLLPLTTVNPSILLHKKISVLQNRGGLQSHMTLKKQEQIQEQLTRLANEHYAYDSDEPLNLCVRDKEISHLAHLNLLSCIDNHNAQLGNKASSANNLFSNFNLKRANNISSSSKNAHPNAKSQGQSPKRGGNSSYGSSGGNKMTNSGDLVSDDSNLVNINLQLNLSASKLADYMNCASKARPLPGGSPNSCSSFSSTDPKATLQLGAGGGRGSKGRRKRTAMYVQNNSRSPRPSALSHPSSHLTCNQGGSSTNNCALKARHSVSPATSSANCESHISPFATSSNNAAEVSICKFKFTGGAKPSLQEKKMLSVDSTGNFRFYSDKPCASSSTSKTGGNVLQHYKDDLSHLTPELLPPHGLPKSAKSMSMCMPVPIPPLTTCSMMSDVHSPSLPPMMSPGDLDCSSSSDGGHSSIASMGHSSHHDLAGSVNKLKIKQKRRTRKSLMREKLEKTFKEKGFLIQTQQLESAEGATYCKFRQLRKFTRYLFRSWKDYLPDNLKGINPASQNSEALGPGGVPLPCNYAESMDQDAGQDETEGGSETPDNMTLSPAGRSQDEENDEGDLGDRDEDIEDT